MQDQLQQMLQQQLRDVHLPDAVSWWPLAPGWWVAGALLLLILIASGLLLRRHVQRNRYRKTALRELENSFSKWEIDQDTGTYLHRANEVLKRTLLHISPAREIARQSGNAWIELLQRHAKRELSEVTQQALAGEHYRPDPRADIDNVHPQLLGWIRTHRRKVGEVKHA
ncbi:MAG: DUF4381 domain-containing protein [Pseudomonadota bacterium]